MAQQERLFFSGDVDASYYDNDEQETTQLSGQEPETSFKVSATLDPMRLDTRAVSCSFSQGLAFPVPVLVGVGAGTDTHDADELPASLCVGGGLDCTEAALEHAFFFRYRQPLSKSLAAACVLAMGSRTRCVVALTAALPDSWEVEVGGGLEDGAPIVEVGMTRTFVRHSARLGVGWAPMTDTTSVSLSLGPTVVETEGALDQWWPRMNLSIFVPPNVAQARVLVRASHPLPLPVRLASAEDEETFPVCGYFEAQTSLEGDSVQVGVDMAVWPTRRPISNESSSKLAATEAGVRAGLGVEVVHRGVMLHAWVRVGTISFSVPLILSEFYASSISDKAAPSPDALGVESDEVGEQGGSNSDIWLRSVWRGAMGGLGVIVLVLAARATLLRTRLVERRARKAAVRKLMRERAVATQQDMSSVAADHVTEERGKGSSGVVILGAWYGDKDAIQQAGEGSERLTMAVEENGLVVDVAVPLQFFLRRSQLR